jgi:hypothetical protein
LLSCTRSAGTLITRFATSRSINLSMTGSMLELSAALSLEKRCLDSIHPRGDSIAFSRRPRRPRWCENNIDRIKEFGGRVLSRLSSARCYPWAYCLCPARSRLADSAEAWAWPTTMSSRTSPGWRIQATPKAHRHSSSVRAERPGMGVMPSCYWGGGPCRTTYLSLGGVTRALEVHPTIV